MDQTLITVSRYSITYYQKDLFICAQYPNKHKATALHKAYWLPCWDIFGQNWGGADISIVGPGCAR